MKKIFYIVCFVLIPFASRAQEKKRIYVDENYKVINFQKFTKKSQSKLFYVINAKTDTALFKKLRFKEFFGKLDLKKKNQLNKLFQKRFKIDTTKIWLIHYIDSLPNIKEMPNKSGIVFLDSLDNEEGEILNKKEFEKTIISRNVNSINISLPKKHKHVISFEDYKKIVLNEIKKYQKFKNIYLLHFYSFNKGYPLNDIDSEKWYKDYNLILKRTFTDGMKMYKTIIVYPNGDFYLNTYGEVKKVLSSNKFSKEKRKWEKQLEKYN